MQEVTAAIILNDHKVLIARRAAGENQAGKWEFPGGKIEAGETPQECLRREIKEELDVEIEVLDFFAASTHISSSGSIKLLAYWCRWLAGEFSLKVHSHIEWVDCEGLAAYDFAPADRPLVKKLRENCRWSL
jgi:8-oxo-dGTP diphosphatase